MWLRLDSIPAIIMQLLRLLIHCVSAIPSRALFGLIRILFIKKYPLAFRFLNHYLSGSGRTITFDTALLLKQDRQLENFIFAKLQNTSAKHGSIFIPQNAFSSRNLKLALGGFWLNWENLGAATSLQFSKHYRWRPEEKRVTQGIHKAAKTLEQNSKAKSFYIRGTKVQRIIPKQVTTENLFFATPSTLYLM